MSKKDKISAKKKLSVKEYKKAKKILKTGTIDNFIKMILAHNPVILPLNVAKLLSKNEFFIRNVIYIEKPGYYVGTKIKPLEGEVGVFNGRRIVVNLPVKNK